MLVSVNPLPKIYIFLTVTDFFSKSPSNYLFHPCQLLRLPHLLIFPLLSVNISSRTSCPQLLKTKCPNSVPFCSVLRDPVTWIIPFLSKLQKSPTLPFSLSLQQNETSPSLPKCFQDVLWAVMTNIKLDFRK